MSLVRLGLVPVLGLLPLLGFGCSDPVPPTPHGAWSLAFIDPGPGCDIGGHNAAMGKVTPTTKDSVLIDGQDGASIDCKVIGSSSFSVEAFTTDAKNGLQMNILISSISKQATKESPAIGSITYSSPTTGGEPLSSDGTAPCIFWFAPSSREGINAGQVWVSFECPKMTIDTSTDCKIQSGVAIFENCDS